MTDNEIIKAIAELDGKGHLHQFNGDPYDRDCYVCGCKPPHENHASFPDYLTSRDAVVPVIEKQQLAARMHVAELLNNPQQKIAMTWQESHLQLLFATPRQLCEALLRATGKWKE